METEKCPIVLSYLLWKRKRVSLFPFDLSARVSKVQFKLVISLIWVISGLMGAPYLFAMGLTRIEKEGDPYYYCYHRNVAKVLLSCNNTITDWMSPGSLLPNFSMMSNWFRAGLKLKSTYLKILIGYFCRS